MSPMRPSSRWLSIVAIVLALCWLALGLHLERFINQIEPVDLPLVSPRAKAFHEDHFVADLHADSLLFDRDLLGATGIGHVDLPRLRSGGVGLQVFSLPTVTPLGMNIDRTEAGGIDMLTLAGIARLSPSAWQSPFARALRQADRLFEFARESDGGLMVIRDRADLEQLLQARSAGVPVVGGLLAIEGAHALESDPDHLAPLFDAGYRMIGLAHFFDNDYAGSAHGVEKGALTDLGRRTLIEMEAMGIVVDLAHLSPAATDEALDLLTQPTVFSHGGVRGTCDNRRNLSDHHIRRIAEGGGVIGIGFWEAAVCGTTPRDIAQAIAYVVQLVGPDHAALGSDYDGATTVGFDPSALPALTQALMDEGLDDETVGKVLGGNVARVLARTLPVRASASGPATAASIQPEAGPEGSVDRPDP